MDPNPDHPVAPEDLRTTVEIATDSNHPNSGSAKKELLDGAAYYRLLQLLVSDYGKATELKISCYNDGFINCNVNERD